MPDNIPNFEPAFFYSQYKEAVYDSLFTGIASGAYIVVYVISVYALQSKPGFTSSSLRLSMFGITTLMFALGIIALVLETTNGFQSFSDNSISGPSSALSVIYNVWETTTCLMCILCDTICAWRTVVLWNGDKRVVAILGFIILVTTATTGCVLVFGLIPGASHLDRSLFSGAIFFYVFPGPILGTNMLSTGLIAWKVWQRRIQVREHLHDGMGPLRVERVFTLLLESGLIYCCIWIFYAISMLGYLPDPGFTVIGIVSGLYPTLIIILVSKQLSPVDHYSTHSTEMQSTGTPALGQPRDGITP